MTHGGQWLFAAVTIVSLGATFGLATPLARASVGESGGGGVPAECVTYAQKLQEVLASPGRVSVEAVFVAGTQAAHALLDVAITDTESVLGGLDSTGYAAVRRSMQGFTIRRDESELVVPDPAFFLSLARSHGDAADRAFFRVLKFTYDGAGGFPAYIEQQTDYSGCVAFGSGLLVATFAKWQCFASQYPRRYERRVGEELRGVEDALESDCACWGKESVAKELRAFVRRFPAAAVTPRVRVRLEQIESGKGGVRYGCISG